MDMDMDSNSPSNNLDNEFRELEVRLCSLAMEWRGNVDNRKEIIERYHATMMLLFSLGWDDILDVDCELPIDDMPQEYLKRHLYTSTSSFGT